MTADLTPTYPIIFSGPIVLALLDGRKTQTRRLAWNGPYAPNDPRLKRSKKVGYDKDTLDIYTPTPWLRRLDRWREGERPWLWVKETFWACDFPETGDLPIVVYEERHHGKRYDHPGNVMIGVSKFGHIPSIHMPKRASRLSLRVTDMRMERLQDISEEDARAEGAGDSYLGDGDPPFTESAVMVTPQMQFRNIWRRIHGPDAWDSNPEVIAVNFEVHQQNIEMIAS